MGLKTILPLINRNKNNKTPNAKGIVGSKTPQALITSKYTQMLKPVTIPEAQATKISNANDPFPFIK